VFVSADITCLVAGSARPDLTDLLQAFQMNHYCDSISFNDFEKIIANHLDKKSIESVASTLLVSELIKSLDIDD
jgi:hypothetical protein